MVDDDSEIAALVSAVLSSEGYEIDVVGTARECFLLLEDAAKRPALIVLDVMLPDLDGFQTLGRLRAATTTAAIPVILLSTLEGKSYRKRAEEKGAAAYLTKPFEPAVLLETVRRASAGPAGRPRPA